MRELTERELGILKLSGYTVKGISNKLCLSIGTVKRHLANIRSKLKVKSRAQFLIVALREKIIDIKDIDGGFEC